MAGKSVRIRARASGASSACPACGLASVRIHSRYERRLADTAAGGQETLVHLQVRRFFCQNDACPRVTFAEQVTGLTSRYARRTTGLGETLGAVALALGGRAGARLSGRLACPASRSTLLRLIRGLPEQPAATPRVLGVDDFALRRGHVYGTVLVDIETRRPIDPLSERSADSFGSWLDSRPGVEVICRDRGGCYAESAARGARLLSRWPTGGICCTTSPTRSSGPLPGTAPACATGPARVQPGLLDPYLPYLHQRWDEGCRSTERLHREVRARGYRGSLRTLRRHTARLRQQTARPAPPPAPASKKVAAWILTPPGNLTDDDRAALDAITSRCPELAATRALVRDFASMLLHRTGSDLPAWADQAEASTVRELRGFAAGLRKDWPAVTAGLTLPYSSGTVEGHVNRIKMIKRQMYGRAKPDLLRKRVLLADRSHHGKWARATATWPLTSSRAVVGGGTKRFRGWPERPVQLRERLAGPQ